METLKELSRKELEQMSCITEDDFRLRDHRLCDCELTYVHRKRHGALGTGVEIRLCCLAKKVEELAGMPEGTFFLALEFNPSWIWDCNSTQKHEKVMPDGSVQEVVAHRGEPPRWLRERMEQKGLPILNSKESLNGQ